MSYLNILQAIAKHVDVSFDKEPGCYKVDGFYKSGTATVDLNKCQIRTRYGEVDTFDTPVDMLETLVELNDQWHSSSQDRFDGWREKDAGWVKIEEELLPAVRDSAGFKLSPGDALAEVVDKVWIGTMPEMAMKNALQDYRSATRGTA